MLYDRPVVGLQIDCPNCGRRDYTEFSFDSEERPDPFHERVVGMALWSRTDAAGRQRERWFHELGCRRWLTIERDTRTNDTRAVV